MWISALFAIAIIAVTSLMLLITKIPVVVILSAGTISSSALVLLVRLDLGYWGPFTHIIFVSNWFFAIAVSFLFVGAGRWLKRPFFLGKTSSESSGSSVRSNPSVNTDARDVPAPASDRAARAGYRER